MGALTMDENGRQGAVGRTKYYIIVLSSILAGLIFLMRLSSWKTSNSKEVSSVSAQLPYASRGQHVHSSRKTSVSGSCTLKQQNDTGMVNDSGVNATRCEQEGQNNTGQELSEKAIPITEAPRCVMQIQLWTYIAFERGFPTGVTPIKCRGSVCDVKLISDRRYETMQYVDALILYHREEWDWNTLYASRPPGQKWIFYSLESPNHTSPHVVPPVEHYNDTYDYIMSYRPDSDFLAGYGEYFPGIPEIGVNDARNWAANRTKLVAWIASNCKGPSWPRTEFVHNLSKYLPVDTYGNCGKERCVKNSRQCDQLLRQYKFYLSLENSQCKDYITEKFWNYIYRELVPIVFGPTRSDYEKVAPPNSFIHVQDFQTLQELADFVKRVANNDIMYNAYFEWKKRGSIRPDYTFKAPRLMCAVADRLAADKMAANKGRGRKHLNKDWSQWWTGSCFDGRIPQ